jgi:hypothetical protein
LSYPGDFPFLKALIASITTSSVGGRVQC